MVAEPSYGWYCEECDRGGAGYMQRHWMDDAIEIHNQEQHDTGPKYVTESGNFQT